MCVRAGMNRYALLVAVCVWGGFGGCSTGGGASDGANVPGQPDSGSRTSELIDHQRVATEVALSIVVVRSEDRQERQARQTSPCPGGGSRTTNPDGSVTFSACMIFPGVTLNGTARITPQGGETQGGRIDLDGITGTTEGGTEFFVDGTIEETENDDGSLSFEIDISSVTVGGGYTDTFNAQGSFRVDEDGTMHGGMTTDINDEDTDFPPTECDFEGHNLLLELDSLMDNACEEQPEQSVDDRCPAGDVCVAPGAGACCSGGSCEIMTGEACAGIAGAAYSAGQSCADVQCVAPADDVVVFYTGNVCCWGAPHLLIGTRSAFEAEQAASSFSGGGIDPSIPVVKLEVQGGFDSVEDARAWLCPQIVSRFDHYWCGSNYVQMNGSNWWIGAGCDLSEVPFTNSPPESNLCE